MDALPPSQQTELLPPAHRHMGPTVLGAANYRVRLDLNKRVRLTDRRRGANRRARRLVVVALLVVAVLGGMLLQHLRTADLEQRLVLAQARVFELNGSQTSTRSEVQSLRDALDRGLDGTQARVSAIEAGSVAPLVAQVANSIALIQGQYQLVDQRTMRPLRYLVVKGDAQSDPDDKPNLTIAGNGPVYLTRFSGTAFVVDDAGTLLTNRHIARPWEHGWAAQLIAQLGVRPKMVALRGFLPGDATPFNVTVVGVSSEHDLAMLRGSGAALSVKPLRMADMVPAPGDAAVVLGYPTGLSALLARADTALVSRLRNQPGMDDMQAANALAQAGLIRPLVSRGIVAQVSAAAVVYDAQTATGGSGGPVVNLRGEVLAVTRAVMEGFNGSNLGVPVAAAREMLQTAN
jgi:S1-C subfamily serine protease